MKMMMLSLRGSLSAWFAAPALGRKTLSRCFRPSSSFVPKKRSMRKCGLNLHIGKLRLTKCADCITRPNCVLTVARRRGIACSDARYKKDASEMYRGWQAPLQPPRPRLQYARRLKRFLLTADSTVWPWRVVRPPAIGLCPQATRSITVFSTVSGTTSAPSKYQFFPPRTPALSRSRRSSPSHPTHGSRSPSQRSWCPVRRYFRHI